MAHYHVGQVCQAGGKPTCFVTLDVPFPLNPVDQELWGRGLLGFQPLKLAAEVVADGEAIIWTPTDDVTNWLKDEVDGLLGRVIDFELGEQVLAHLTLKGNFIWTAPGTPHLYLDGEAFGFPDPSSGETQLRLPSGNGRCGSDFEMWFRLVKG